MDLPTLPAPGQRALATAGYTSLEQLTAVTEAELPNLHGFGPKALRLLREDLTRAWFGVRGSLAAPVQRISGTV
jgi:hypothetical protein